MNSNIESRCLTLKEAAAYVGLHPRSYRDAVRRGIYPDKIPGTRRYDRYAIDARLNATSGIKDMDPDIIVKPHISAYDEWFGDES